MMTGGTPLLGHPSPRPWRSMKTTIWVLGSHHVSHMDIHEETVVAETVIQHLTATSSWHGYHWVPIASPWYVILIRAWYEKTSQAKPWFGIGMCWTSSNGEEIRGVSRSCFPAQKTERHSQKVYEHKPVVLQSANVFHIWFTVIAMIRYKLVTAKKVATERAKRIFAWCLRLECNMLPALSMPLRCYGCTPGASASIGRCPSSSESFRSLRHHLRRADEANASWPKDNELILWISMDLNRWIWT